MKMDDGFKMGRKRESIWAHAGRSFSEDKDAGSCIAIYTTKTVDKTPKNEDGGRIKPLLGFSQ
jgi:hypothetical protein